MMIRMAWNENHQGWTRKIRAGAACIAFVGLILFVSACASPSKNTPPPPKAEDLAGVHLNKIKPPDPSKLPPLAELKPQLAMEEEMPFEGKLFSLSARNTPIQDVLLGLAREAGLNLVMQKGVNPLEPVSLEIHDLSLKEALETLLSSYGYFFETNKNILKVKATDTRIFHFDYPMLSSTPSSDIGGDVLGNVGGNSGGSSEISGDFSIETEIDDDDHLSVWKQIEDAIQPYSESGSDKKGILSENGRAKINRMSGTIVVTDTREHLELVDQFLKELSASLRRQVVIEAKIVEVTLNQGHSFGIDWSAIRNANGDIFSVASNLSTGNVAALATLDGTSSSGSFNLGFLNLTGNWTVGGLLDAISTQGNINILSSPRVNVMNNQSAIISIGSIIPFVDYTVQTITNDENRVIGFDSVPVVARAQSGITLGVTPQVGEDGVTTLHIVPVITDENGSRSLNINGQVVDIPVFDIRESATTVSAPDGATVVLGGLIQDKVTDSTTKVPFLGDVPLLGKLFTRQQRSNQKSELVIFLTPTVVNR